MKSGDYRENLQFQNYENQEYWLALSHTYDNKIQSASDDKR